MHDHTDSQSFSMNHFFANVCLRSATALILASFAWQGIGKSIYSADIYSVMHIAGVFKCCWFKLSWLFCILGSKSVCSQWVLDSTRAVPCLKFHLWYSWTSRRSWRWRLSSLGSLGWHLWMMLSWWPCWAVTSSGYLGGLWPCVKWWEWESALLNPEKGLSTLGREWFASQCREVQVS